MYKNIANSFLTAVALISTFNNLKYFRSIIFSIALSLFIVGSAQADFTDTFTAPDGTDIHTYNANYTVEGNPVTIQNNAIAPYQSTISILNNAFTDGCMSMSWAEGSPNTNMSIRMGGSGYYRFIQGPPGFWRLVNQNAVLDSGFLDFNGTHTFKLCAVGSTVSVYKDGEQFVNVVDTVVTSGGIQNFYSEGNVLDNLGITSVISSNEGGAYSRSGYFSDPDSTSWTASVNYGDGSGLQPLTLSGANFSLNHVYKDNGTYTVTVRITDNQGATGTETDLLKVANVAPSVGTISLMPLPAHRNSSITAYASFADPGILDTHTATWNWGDGNTSPATVAESNGSGSATNSHAYSTFGTYNITLTVIDKDTASASRTTPLTVVKQLTKIDPVQVYISRQLPTIRLDLKAEIYKDANLISSGQLNSIAPGMSATLESIPFNTFAPIDFPAGSELQVVLYVRNACSGSILNSGNATLYYNNTPVDSRFSTTIGDINNTYHLRNAFALSTTSGMSQRTTVMAAGAKCSAFKSFGTWRVTPE